MEIKTFNKEEAIREALTDVKRTDYRVKNSPFYYNKDYTLKIRKKNMKKYILALEYLDDLLLFLRRNNERL